MLSSFAFWGRTDDGWYFRARPFYLAVRYKAERDQDDDDLYHNLTFSWWTR